MDITLVTVDGQVFWDRGLSWQDIIPVHSGVLLDRAEDGNVHTDVPVRRKVTGRRRTETQGKMTNCGNCLWKCLTFKCNLNKHIENYHVKHLQSMLRHSKLNFIFSGYLFDPKP